LLAARHEQRRPCIDIRLAWFEDADFHSIADALGCSDLHVAEQCAEVKRFKSRILQRARRTRC
jgi:hypothetical protein